MAQFPHPSCQAAKIGDHCYSVYWIELLKKNPKGSFPWFCVPFLLILYRATCCLHQGCGRWTIAAHHSPLVIYHISETAWHTHCYPLSLKFWSFFLTPCYNLYRCFPILQKHNMAEERWDNEGNSYSCPNKGWVPLTCLREKRLQLFSKSITLA